MQKNYKNNSYFPYININGIHFKYTIAINRDSLHCTQSPLPKKMLQIENIFFNSVFIKNFYFKNSFTQILKKNDEYGTIYLNIKTIF